MKNINVYNIHTLRSGGFVVGLMVKRQYRSWWW